MISRLVDAGYRVITSNDVFPEAMKKEDREIKALVEYYVGFGASRCGLVFDFVKGMSGTQPRGKKGPSPCL